MCLSAMAIQVKGEMASSQNYYKIYVETSML